MLVNKIQQYIVEYTKWLQSLREHPHAYWWDAQQQFQQHWDVDAADPVAMYDACLNNRTTRRLWQVDNWQPKRVMLEFWRFDATTARTIFNELFNETREVDGRIGRFLFGCDMLLADYKSAKPTTIENHHYHDDYQMISLYLAFRYPDQYGAPYAFPMFQQALKNLGARDVPLVHDLARFLKMQRTLMTFLEKDGKALPALQKHLQEPHCYQGKSMLAATDLMWFIGQK
jgi:hypothetical protein